MFFATLRDGCHFLPQANRLCGGGADFVPKHGLSAAFARVLAFVGHHSKLTPYLNEDLTI
jgi:hypothetical protein